MSTKEINQIVEEVIQLFAENNHGQACLIASVILNELLCKHGYTSNIVEGYSRFNVFGKRMNALHYWVNVGVSSIDIGRHIMVELGYNAYDEFREGLYTSDGGYDISTGDDDNDLRSLYNFVLTHSMDDYINLPHIPTFVKEYWIKKTKSRKKNRSKKLRKQKKNGIAAKEISCY